MSEFIKKNAGGELEFDIEREGKRMNCKNNSFYLAKHPIFLEKKSKLA